MYGLTDDDLQIQARARGFADELIPFEEEAERSGGELPGDLAATHAKRARELGLQATNMPADLGGGGSCAAGNCPRRERHVRAVSRRPGHPGTGPGVRR